MAINLRPTKIEAIFFDLYDTLARFWPPRYEIQSMACAAYGLTVTSDGINLGYRYADAFMAEENSKNPIGRRSQAGRRNFFTEYQKMILDGAGIMASDSLATLIWDEVNKIPYRMTLYDDVLGTMETLRNRGITLGVISNMDRPGGLVGAELGLNTKVDFVLTSMDAKATKPDPQIFLAALDRAKTSYESVIHVGDQYKSDVQGALSVGIYPILIDRHGTLVSTGDRKPDQIPSIGNLDELLRLLFPKERETRHP